MPSRLDAYNQALTKQEIDAVVEKTRREAMYDSLHQAQKETVKRVDEVLTEYFLTIIAKRLPTNLLKRATRQIDSWNYGGVGAEFTHSWTIRRGNDNGLINSEPLIELPSAELSNPTQLNPGDLAKFQLNFAPPWDGEQKTYLEKLDPELYIHFWDFDSAMFDGSWKCLDQIRQASLPGIFVRSSAFYSMMDHTVHLPLRGQSLEEVEHTATTIAPLVAPFILARDE